MPPRPLLRFDGASRGNPGKSSAAFVLWEDNTQRVILAEGAHAFEGAMTNNQAEYMGFIAGLRCVAHMGLPEVSVEGDSNLVIEHLFGSFKVRSPNLAPYYQEACRCKAALKAGSSGRWIPREQNGHADALCNAVFVRGAKSRKPEFFEIPKRRLNVLDQLAR